jgi:hypothetical protein
VANALAQAQPYGFEYVKGGPSASDYHAALIAVRTLDDLRAGAPAAGEGVSFRLVKDGRAWDYFTHQSDAFRYSEKIRAEEPEAETRIEISTRAALERFKSGD